MLQTLLGSVVVLCLGHLPFDLQAFLHFLQSRPRRQNIYANAKHVPFVWEKTILWYVMVINCYNDTGHDCNSSISLTFLFAAVLGC